MQNKGTVAILGASDNPERYSNKAQKLLLEHGYQVLPVNPALKQIDSLKVYPNLSALKTAGEEGQGIDTLTIYLGPKRSEALIQDIITLNPKRVILNPGTESRALEDALAANNIPFEKACTLVLLKTGQF
jgi:predicted CoA-binding protein